MVAVISKDADFVSCPWASSVYTQYDIYNSQFFSSLIFQMFSFTRELSGICRGTSASSGFLAHPHLVIITLFYQGRCGQGNHAHILNLSFVEQIHSMQAGHCTYDMTCADSGSVAAYYCSGNCVQHFFFFKGTRPQPTFTNMAGFGMSAWPFVVSTVINSYGEEG